MRFRESNQDIKDDFYGDALDRINKLIKTKMPKPEDYCLPRNRTEWDSMFSKMQECGITKEKASEIMKERQDKFERACEAHKVQSKNSTLTNGRQQN